VQFDHVTVGITQEQPPGLTAEVHRPSARLQASCMQLFNRRVQVGAEKGEVGDARRFVGAVHEDVGLRSCRRIEDQIDFHSTGVSEDRDWFRADRPGHQPEAESGVEGGRSLHVVNADTDVGQTADAGERLWHAVVCSRWRGFILPPNKTARSGVSRIGNHPWTYPSWLDGTGFTNSIWLQC